MPYVYDPAPTLAITAWDDSEQTRTAVERIRTEHASAWNREQPQRQQECELGELVRDAILAVEVPAHAVAARWSARRPQR